MCLFHQEWLKQFISMRICFICRCEWLTLCHVNGVHRVTLSHHCGYQREKQSLAVMELVSKHCSYHIWSNWLPGSSAGWLWLPQGGHSSEQFLATSQVHIIGAIIIPFYRWKNRKNEKTKTRVQNPVLAQVLRQAASSGWDSKAMFLSPTLLPPWFQKVTYSEWQIFPLMLSQGWW